jgi:E3 ubiquitin-protein ligase SIAH1
MESESSDQEESLLIELECPVCTEYMVPPIILCGNGHKVCRICRLKIQNCPTCRGCFSVTRNLALENLAGNVKYPCKFRTYGCTETCNYDTIDKHQAICLYFQQKCPAAKLGIGACSWTGCFKDVEGHLRENHLEHCCEYVEGDFKYLYQLSSNMKVCCFIFAYSEIFFSSFEAKDEKIFYAVLLYIGPAESETKYKYRVEFVNQDNTESVTVMCLTRSCEESLQDVYRLGNCVKLHYDVVKHFMKKSNLKYKLEIIKVCN